ncbi:hypothetical protein KCP70_21290 [Salmonella enterica subsp. enterica]|nr:hypothetical protein KCP70_21290 [Salmonella enterica subsp. enterica]
MLRVPGRPVTIVVQVVIAKTSYSISTGRGPSHPFVVSAPQVQVYYVPRFRLYWCSMFVTWLNMKLTLRELLSQAICLLNVIVVMQKRR